MYCQIEPNKLKEKGKGTEQKAQEQNCTEQIG